MNTKTGEMKNGKADSTAGKRIAVYFAVALTCLFLASCAQKNSAVRHGTLTATSTDGSRIAYGAIGKGEITLLFVHGWLCDHTYWRHQINYFSKNYKVIWLDLAGHGYSKPNRRHFTMSAFARDVKSVYDKVGGKNVILIGHSMGGPIVIEAAGLLKEKVMGIVGVDAFYTPLASVPEAVKMAFLETLKKDYPAALAGTVRSMFVKSADSDLIDQIYKNMLAADQQIGISALYECIKWNAQKESLALKQFSDKLQNINGAPEGNEKAMHESVTLIPGAGHFLYRIKPNEFNAALERIIQNFDMHSKETDQ